MSVLNNSLLLGAPAATGYTISRSLRFNSADSAYLSRTPASAGNRKTWTWAGWVKRSGLSAAGYNHLFSTGTILSEVGYFGISFWEDKLDVTTGAADLRKTAAVYRDASAWYHIVVAVDTTQATAANRVKVYVNGVEVTAFSTNANPTQNADLAVNNTGAHALGRNTYNSSDYFNGYLADVHFIDGQALDSTSFGEFSATTGVWAPKAFTGSYGTNGFHLEFADNSSNTATTLGKDTSPNGNNWTPNNLSVTAGAGNDSLIDVPTNGSEVDSGLGNQVRGNYCCWNPLAVSTQGIATLTNGNLDLAYSDGGNYYGALSTFALSTGKWYWEYTVTAFGSSNGTGIIAVNEIRSAAPANYGYADATNCRYRNLTYVSGGGALLVTGLSSLTSGDIIGVAVNFDAGKIWFSRNGTWELSGSPSAGTGATTTFTTGVNYYLMSQGYGTWSGSLNAGQRPFAYTAPSGFKALCTANLPAPTIVQPSTVFDTKLYTSNAGTLTVSGLGFSPDFAWLKSRGTAVAHALYDTVRGAGRALSSNLTDAEKYTTDGFVSFNSDGFTLGANVNSPQPDINYTNNVARVAWCWDAGNTTVTDNTGSIQSTRRTNASAGISIVSYTGNGVNGASIGHGLGVAPHMVISKSRSNSGTSWAVFHKSLGGNKNLWLDLTNAASTGSTWWHGTDPSSSVVYVGSGSNETNQNGWTFVQYCFAPVAGLSAFGSYTGNSSADGPFVYTGFRPRWVMIKITNTGTSIDHWVMWDTARDDYNVADSYLLANNPQQEVTSSAVTIDALSNGFKLRNSSSNQNGSGSTYVYAAFAEAPFQYARAR
jgi:hypothetical protein